MKLNISKLNTHYQDFIKTYHPTTEASDEFLIICHIAAIASAIGISRYVIRGTAKIYPNIWVIILGESATSKKTTSLDIGTKFIQEREYQEREETDQSHTYILTTSTSTSIFLETLNANKNGIMTASEFKTLLDNMNKKFNGDFKSTLTTLFDVPLSIRFHYRSINNGKPVVVTKPCFSLAGASTFSWFKNTIVKSDLESGFLARFIFCSYSNTDKLIPNPPQPDEKAVEALKNKFVSLYDLEEREVKMNEDAKTIYESFYIENKKLMKKNRNSKLNPFLGRLVDCYCIKFALIEAVLAGKDIIGEEEMIRAIYLTEYFLAQIKKLLSDLIKDPTREFEERILKIIDSKGRVATSEFYNILHCNSKKLMGTLNPLVESQILVKVEETRSDSKKPTTYYQKKEK